jgi:hypothetical protein
MRWLLVSACLSVLLVFGTQRMRSQSSAENATITGHVLDPDNRPVKGAKVSILPMEAGISGSLASAVTDSSGGYKLVAPPLGRTRFCASKESAGYPDTQGLLFTSGKESMPEEYLSPGSYITVDIHLGPPDGIWGGPLLTRKPTILFRKRALLSIEGSPNRCIPALCLRVADLFFHCHRFPFQSQLLRPDIVPGNTRIQSTGVVSWLWEKEIISNLSWNS